MDVYSYTWEVGDRLILASDGLRALPEADLAQLALTGSPTQIARALVTEALRRDDSDNATAVVAVWQDRPAARTRPAVAGPAARAAPPSQGAPAWRQLSLLTVVAMVAGLLVGWVTAGLVFVSLGGLELLR